MQSQINLTPITQFIQLLRAAELGQQREIKMQIQQARLLNLALAEIMDKINTDYESMYNSLKKSVDNEVVSVTMDGGGFGIEK
jgi:hypothetical protein